MVIVSLSHRTVVVIYGKDTLFIHDGTSLFDGGGHDFSVCHCILDPGHICLYKNCLHVEGDLLHVSLNDR